MILIRKVTQMAFEIPDEKESYKKFYGSPVVRDMGQPRSQGKPLKRVRAEEWAVQWEEGEELQGNT